MDDVGHGTNVASIVARLAPSAQILALDVFKPNNLGQQRAADSDVLDAINWALGAAHSGRYNLCAINLSLASQRWFETPCGLDGGYGTAYQQTFAVAMDAGVLVTAAAGNDGMTK